jgi:hypothetical protein
LVELLVHGAPGDWAEIANLEYGRPRTTAAVPHAGKAFVGGRWTGPQAVLQLRGDHGCHRADVGADGLFAFGPISPGAYELLASAAGDAPAFSRWLDIRASRLDLLLPG